MFLGFIIDFCHFTNAKLRKNPRCCKKKREKMVFFSNNCELCIVNYELFRTFAPLFPKAPE